MRRDRARALLAVMLVVALAAACGVPANDGPQAIARRDLPPDLLDPNPGSSTTLPEGTDTTTVPVYLLEETPDGVRLVTVDREVTQSTIPNERLAALFGGATSGEAERGISSAIPADTVLLDVTTDEEAQEVMVDLSEDIGLVQGEALAQAFAQIVYTATEPAAGGYRQVRFSVNGEPTPVLDGDLVPQDRAVTRADYRAVAPD